MHCRHTKPVGSNARSTTASLPFNLSFLVLWSVTITTTITVINRHGMTLGVSASPVVVVGGAASSSSSSSSRRNRRLSDLVPLPSPRRQQPQLPFQRRCLDDDIASPLDTVQFVSSSSTLPVESTVSASGITGSSSVGGESSSRNKNNMIVSLFLYVKDSTVRTAQSCTQLYKNHQRCNQIRQKQSLYRNTIKEQWENDPDQTSATSKQKKQQLQQLNGGISYEEYIFLQLGKEDRGKVMNLAFLMYGAPKILPYALMFNKNMLPSTFTQSNTGGRTTTSGMSSDDPSNMEITTASPTTTSYYETTLRQYERRQAMINTLYNMEKQLITLIMGEMTNGNNNGNNNFVANIFTKSSSNHSSKSQQKMILHHVLSEMSDLFRRGMITMGSKHQNTNNNNNNNNHPKKETTNMGASYLLQKCEPYLYRTGTEYSGLELRLGHLPPCIVQGMANALFHFGIPNSITQLTPKVFHRRKFVGHIEKITKADEFLVSNNIDVATIPKHLLIEACHDRMIHVGRHRNMVPELRTALSDWLQLTKPKFATSSSSSLLPTTSDSSMATPPPPMLETANVRTNRHSRNDVMTVSSKSSPTVRPVASMMSTTSTRPEHSAADPVATKVYYNSNLARMILMAYYGCASICDDANESMPATIGHLPQLLYRSSTSSSGK